MHGRWRAPSRSVWNRVRRAVVTEARGLRGRWTVDVSGGRVMRSNGRDEDVLDLLMQEHRELEGLLRDLRYAGTAQQRRARADQLIASLVRHSLVGRPTSCRWSGTT